MTAIKIDNIKEHLIKLNIYWWLEVSFVWISTGVRDCTVIFVVC